MHQKTKSRKWNRDEPRKPAYSTHQVCTLSSRGVFFAGYISIYKVFKICGAKFEAKRTLLLYIRQEGFIMTIEIKSFDDNTFAVSFPEGFSRKILDAVRSVPGKIWQGDKKLWLIPNTQKAKDILLENLYKTGELNVKVPDSYRKDKLEPNKLKDVLQARHYSYRTVESYMNWVKKFLSVYKTSKNLGQNQINEFLTNLAVKEHVSPSTQNQALAALLFYFRYIRNEKADNFSDVIRAKIKNVFLWFLPRKRSKL